MSGADSAGGAVTAGGAITVSVGSRRRGRAVRAASDAPAPTTARAGPAGGTSAALVGRRGRAVRRRLRDRVRGRGWEDAGAPPFSFPPFSSPPTCRPWRAAPRPASSSLPPIAALRAPAAEQEAPRALCALCRQGRWDARLSMADGRLSKQPGRAWRGCRRRPGRRRRVRLDVFGMCDHVNTGTVLKSFRA